MPEYNSDDSDDEFPKQSENEPLFPSSGYSCNTTQIALKGAFDSHDQSNNNEKSAKKSRSNSPQSSNSDPMIKKTKPSFASIITGGRSPQNESEIQKYIGECLETPSESSEISVSDQPKEPEILSQKTFKRKRRIEFSVGGVQAKKLNQNDDQGDKDEKTDNMEPVQNENSTLASIRNKHGHFQKGETEFSEHTTTDTLNQSDNNNKGDDNNTSLQKNQQIADQHCLLESKLKFLAQGRTDVSPVQVIQIQLQVCSMFSVRIANLKLLLFINIFTSL